MYSDNISYARNRLVGTIVMHKGEPVNILQIDLDGDTHFQYLLDETQDCCFVDDLDLVGQNKLGYVNYNGHSYHLVRKPLRHDWRQGLRPGNVAFSGEEGFHAFPNKALRNTIVGNYPKFQEALDKVTKGKLNRVAFSRNFALDRDKSLHYKGRVVGSFDKLINLQERFKYLTESLNDILEGNYAYD